MRSTAPLTRVRPCRHEAHGWDERPMLSGLAHLARRFFWSLSNRAPDPVDDAWLTGLLSDKEQHLYSMMSNQDRRHAIECARLAQELLGDGATNEVIVASALHDVGKTPARLGTFGRVMATVLQLSPKAGDAWMERTHLVGRLRRYNQHSTIGAELLTGAGSADIAVRWALEHHLDPDEWTLDRELGLALAAADGEPRD